MKTATAVVVVAVAAASPENSHIIIIEVITQNIQCCVDIYTCVFLLYTTALL